jgi:protein-L-isoaspartate(D-aspartate) O-methyltransferase
MDFVTARNHMVEAQVACRGVHDCRVLAAMREVPREAFVDAGFEEFAYEDSPLPIAEGQTISQPFIVAAMAAAAGIEPGDRVLEVGSGSGYAAAVFSHLAAKVFAIERHAALTGQATERFRILGYRNILLMTGDGSKGWPQKAPFDAIIVSAGAPKLPETLKAQLKIGASLVAPVGGEKHVQRLQRVTRTGKSGFEEEDLGAVSFVPLIGAEGWDSHPNDRGTGGRQVG